AWIERTLKNSEYLFSAVVDRATGEAAGRQALMRIEPAHGVIEIGNILWGPAISRTRISTEAYFLAARHVFDELGYRRFEWKCNNRNEPSKAAAVRFGFTYEGLFRQHMVVKGENRDTAWFSIIDGEWPSIRAAFERWLDPANFDSAGRQKARLGGRKEPTKDRSVRWSVQRLSAQRERAMRTIGPELAALAAALMLAG